MAIATPIRTDIDEILPGVIADRRHLHEHPELGFQEVKTAKFVTERLESLGLDDIRTGLGVTGVTALIRGGKGDGKVVIVRADMDALPILEENEVDYVSQNPGVMHACGHDAHTAMLLGLTRVLKDRQHSFAGTVKVLFQPAEELPPGGAIRMIEDGVLEDPKVDAAFGLHVGSNMPSGTIGLRAGQAMAAGDRFRITIHGRGGHAAHPYRAIDPIVVGSQIVTALQTLVSRETDPIKSLVVSTTAFLAGDAFNVIPDTAELRGTIRSLDPEVREHANRRIVELAEGIGTAFGATVDVELIHGYPSVSNDAALCQIVKNAAIDEVGGERVIEMPPIMGGEDFSRFGEVVPAMFFFVGTGNPDRDSEWPHHHPRFDIDEEAMAPGIATMARSVLAYLAS